MFNFSLFDFLRQNQNQNQIKNFSEIGIPFRQGDKKYYIIGLDGSETLNKIPNITKKTLGQIYGGCFSEGDLNTINNLNNFTEGSGVTVIIINTDGNCQFIVSLVKNEMTNHIEFFNICKNLEQSDLRGYHILDILIKYFLPDNPMFSNYKNLRLALLCDNPYLIPAFKTYCQLGFQVELERQPVKSMLANYITMSRSLDYCESTNFREQLNRLMEVCEYSDIMRETLIEKIVD